MHDGVVLADTSVWIQPPHEGFARYAREVAVSVITVAELQHGLFTAPTPIEELNRRRRLQLLLDHYEVINLDIATTEVYGVLARMVTQQAGRKVRSRAMDLLIAATAARHGMPLLTRNAADLTGTEQAVIVVPVT
ncbi:PIN domain-containing protein [Pseudonocardia sp. NPDC049154]|uniref:PIN domain-containing protein n=1 Tax=Pseudonocardia sp. NPDC049154 TaxID=3155501 RepID=UPI0033C3A3DA